jgi:hypothetical protein
VQPENFFKWLQKETVSAKFLDHRIFEIDNKLPIICFKIKNPPTLYSTLKIQPTTSPIFVFSVSASARKKWGYERKLLDSRFGRSSSCFFILFIISLKRYDWYLFVHNNYFVLCK